MSQLIQTSTGEIEGHNDDHKLNQSANFIDNSSPSQISSWMKQNNLPDTLMYTLRQNEIFTLDDLTLFESEQERTEFVGSLGLKFATKKKFISAIKTLLRQTGS